MLRDDPIALFEAGAAMGDVAYLRLPRFPVYLLNHPDLVWDVLATSNQAFMKGPTMQAAKLMLGESLLTGEGEHHRRQRRLIQPLFHHERIAGYGAAMVELADRAADRWSAGDPIDVHAEMSRLTLAIVGRTLFDTDVEGEQAREIGAALSQTLAQFNRVFSPFLVVTRRLPIPSTRRFERARAVFDRTIYAMIATRRRTGVTGDDLLSLLLRAQEDGAGMSDEQVRDEAITLFLAGHETTSNALTWTWYLLSQNPDEQARLHAELDEGLGGRPPTVEDLPAVPTTSTMISEAMRLYPPAWAIGRRALVDREAGGYRIPSGSVVVVSPWLIHRDPRWWPAPLAFQPERWEQEDPGRPRHAYLPFGGGPRMCIGEGFALMEARLVLATIARRWRFELDPTQRVETQPVVTLRPRYGMRMIPHERRRPAPGAA
jgi:cytochrome P450